MKRKQWTWQPRGWHLMVSVGRSWGLGFFVIGRNGTDIYIGPVVFSIAPPVPTSWRFMTNDEIAKDKTIIGG
jgi:hypothetical protein